MKTSVHVQHWWLAIVGLILFWASDAVAQSVVGPKRCGYCHQEEYNRWFYSPHARAYLSLSSTELADVRCYSCHNDMTFTQKTQIPVGVHCEMCHGSGQHYAESYVMKDKELSEMLGLIPQGPAQCQKCHTDQSPSVRPFDFIRMWNEIGHGQLAQQAAADGDFKSKKSR